MRSTAAPHPPCCLPPVLAGCTSVRSAVTSSVTPGPAAGASGRRRSAGAGRSRSGPARRSTTRCSSSPRRAAATTATRRGSRWRTRQCTPGAISPAVTQANLKSTICRKGGYTSGIRPSTYVTGKEKALNAASYGYNGRMGDAEYDHLISLQLGGDPNDPRNLWVEPADPGHKTGAGVNNRRTRWRRNCTPRSARARSPSRPRRRPSSPTGPRPSPPFTLG